MPEVRALGAGSERPRALLVGCGGAGCNALRAVPVDARIGLLAVNDLPHHSLAGIRRRLVLDKGGLRALASLDDKAVKTLVTTPEQAVAVELGDAEWVVPVAGLGGEMGSWGAGLVARVAALKGATTMAVVSLPFSAEGSTRRAVASEAAARLRQHAHGVLVLPNDPLLKVAAHLPIARAFEVMSHLAVQPVLDFLQVLTRDDLPNLEEMLRRATEWRVGIAEGVGPHPELAAVEAAFDSPWIGRPAEDAKGVIALVGTPEREEKAVREILHDVNLRAPSASVLWGAFREPEGLRATFLLGF